jgi:uncharacterized protein with PIN domain
LSSSAEARVGKPPVAPVKLNLADHYSFAAATQNANTGDGIDH